MTMDGTFTPIAGMTYAAYTPVEADEGHHLRATASYTDGEGAGKTAMATTTTILTAADQLFANYDTNTNDVIDKTELITAIEDYLGFGTGEISKLELIRLINLYLGLT